MNSNFEFHPHFDLHCPTCNYWLRGLTRHRCPECGTAFDPEVLTNTALRTHSHRGRMLGDLCLVPAISAVVYVGEILLIAFNVPVMPFMLLIEWTVVGLAMSAYITADHARPFALIISGGVFSGRSYIYDRLRITVCGAALFLFQACVVAVFVIGTGWLLLPDDYWAFGIQW